jgi:hypothetical protein
MAQLPVCVYVFTCIMSILLSTAQGKENQWVIENNLAHLLEYTPGLKTLHVPLRSVSFRLMNCGGLARNPPDLAWPVERHLDRRPENQACLTLLTSWQVWERPRDFSRASAS